MKLNKKVISESKTIRLDRFLVQQLASEFDFSRAKIQKLIASGAVRVNQEIVTTNKFLVNLGDEVSLDIPQPTTRELAAISLGLEIIYQDPDLLVVNKPNNLVVHPGAGKETKTLVHGLLALDTSLSQIEAWRPGIVHRLDKQTTGLLIIAKNDIIHRKLADMFSKHQIKKEYLALVQGVIAEQGGRMELPIGRSVKNRKQMAVNVTHGKPAITHFQVLERFPQATLVKINLETGRTHQIRVHFHHIKHPVYNDPLYGQATKDDGFGQYLHAWRLSFKHPMTGKSLTFEAPLPPEFDDKIKELRKK